MVDRGYVAGSARSTARNPLPLLVEPRMAWAGALLLVAGLLCTIMWAPRPRLLWNTSESSPIGLYRVAQAAELTVGAMVIAWPPVHARRLGAVRQYLPGNVPLVKRVAAATGDRVCAVQDRIFVNSRLVARRRRADHLGRRLPWWTGCETVATGDVFLLMEGRGNSFDGRYFGVTRRDQIVGRATMLWAR